MIRLFQIAVFSCLPFCLIGCNASEEGEPIWQRVKLGDLAPPHNGKQDESQSLKTINFNVYIFEMPAENITVLDDIWQILYTSPFQFNDYDAFCSNSFLVGFGPRAIANLIADLLRAAGGKRIQTVSVLLPDGQTNDVTIARLYRKQPIFYVSANGSTEGATIGPGKLALRIKAEKVAGLRGLCNVSAQPIFTSPVRSAVPELAARTKFNEYPFTSAGFGLKMGPGDIFFLGPEKYIDGQVTLASYFFSRPAPSSSVRMLLIPPAGDSQTPQPYFGPVVRTYMIICTGIND